MSIKNRFSDAWKKVKSFFGKEEYTEAECEPAEEPVIRSSEDETVELCSTVSSAEAAFEGTVECRSELTAELEPESDTVDPEASRMTEEYKQWMLAQQQTEEPALADNDEKPEETTAPEAKTTEE